MKEGEEMKRSILLTLCLLTLCLFLLSVFPNVAAAASYEPGLLMGKTLIGDGDTKNLQYINDNNASTTTNIYYYFSYTFPDPVNLTGYYINGTKLDYNSRISFYRADNSLIKQIYVAKESKLGVLQNEEVLQVKKIQYSNGDGFFDYISDFEVYKAVDLTPPGDPQDVTAKALNDTQIQLSWTPPNDADFKQIHVYRNGLKVATVPKTATTTTISNLTPETEYTFVIRAVDNDNNESVGVPVTARTLETPPTEPPPPGSVKIELDGAATYTAAALKFQASKASGIKLYRDGQVIASLPGNATTYRDATLQPGRSYQYWIVAENAIGTTASAILTVNTPELKPPTDVKISAQSVTDTVATLAFSAKDAESIKLYRDGMEIASLSGNVTSYQDNTLKTDTSYRYWIVARNAKGATASDIITVQTLLKASVKNLRSIEKTIDHVRFAWNKEPTAEKYKIELTVTHRLTASMDWAADAPPTTTTTLESTTNEINVTNLKPGERVDIAVSLVNATFGVHGTARTSEVVPVVPIPEVDKSDLFTPKDLLDTSASLVWNFSSFILFALAFIVAPWIIYLFRKSTKAPKPTAAVPRTIREQQREIRLSLRKGE